MSEWIHCRQLAHHLYLCPINDSENAPFIKLLTRCHQKGEKLSTIIIEDALKFGFLIAVEIMESHSGTDQTWHLTSNDKVEQLNNKPL